MSLKFVNNKKLLKTGGAVGAILYSVIHRLVVIPGQFVYEMLGTEEDTEEDVDVTIRTIKAHRENKIAADGARVDEVLVQAGLPTIASYENEKKKALDDLKILKETIRQNIIQKEEYKQEIEYLVSSYDLLRSGCMYI